MAVDDTKQPPPPIIATEWGNVTEGARLQAARNMVRDPTLKAKMIAQWGEAMMRRNYPEAFEDEDDYEETDKWKLNVGDAAMEARRWLDGEETDYSDLIAQWKELEL